MENNKLFITNLNFNTPLHKLVELCAAIGSVKDSYRPEGKGFAFITMHTSADAQKVIDDLSGVMLDGRQLKIEVSVPREQRSARPAGAPSDSRPPRREETPRPAGSPPVFSSPSAPRKDDKKKSTKYKEDEFNKGPAAKAAKAAKAKLAEKSKGGANRNRWIDDLDDDEDIDLDVSLIEDDAAESEQD